LVEAPSIQFDRDRRSLVAQGTAAHPVSTVLVQEKLVQPNGAQPDGTQPDEAQPDKTHPDKIQPLNRGQPTMIPGKLNP